MVGVEAVVAVGVADLAHRFAHQCLNIDVTGRGDFTGDERQAGAEQRFCRNPRLRVERQNSVEHAVADAVGELVRVGLQ